MKQEKILTYILLAFSIEYLGYGQLSVFRVIILPLTLYGLLTIKAPNYGRNVRTSTFLVVFMLYFALCNLYTDTNPLFAVLCIPFMIYMGKCVSSGLLCRVDVGRIFSLYSLPHFFAFLFMRSHAFLEEGRFNGLHEDSNFCGNYLLIAVVSSMFLLLYKDNTKKAKYFDLFNSVTGIALIILTCSRGAILTFLIFVCYLFYKSHIPKYAKISILVALGFGFVSLNAYIESLSIFVSADSGYVDFILSRFKEENMEGGSNRLEFWSMAYNAMVTKPFIPIGTNFLNRIFYTHSTYVDICLEIGFVQGIIFCIYYLISTLSKLKLLLRGTDFNYTLMYCCAILLSIQLSLLSADREKLFWMMVCFILYKPIVYIRDDKQY